MTDTAPLFPSLPAVPGKKVGAAFDGGRITSDGGVLLLASTRARRMCGRLASLVPDARDPTRIRHDVADMFPARSPAIAAGYEDADDLDDLRHDPAFKTAPGKTPGAKTGPVGQPTMPRWENKVDPRVAIKMANIMIDAFRESCEAAPTSITLDIDETFDATHGEQQLAFWNGFYGERGFLPIHVCEIGTGRAVAFVLRPAKTPSGKELRVMYAASSDASGRTGHGPLSCCGVMAAIPGQRSWPGAKHRRALITSSVCRPARPYAMTLSFPEPGMPVPFIAPKGNSRSREPFARPDTPLRVGIKFSAVSSPGSGRRKPAAWTSATSSPR